MRWISMIFNVKYGNTIFISYKMNVFFYDLSDAYLDVCNNSISVPFSCELQPTTWKGTQLNSLASIFL